MSTDHLLVAVAGEVVTAGAQFTQQLTQLPSVDSTERRNEPLAPLVNVHLAG